MKVKRQQRRRPREVVFPLNWFKDTINGKRKGTVVGGES